MDDRTHSRPVMNPPADEAEAGNRANTAPRQADPDAPCRGETGASSGAEARPVIATEQYYAEMEGARALAEDEYFRARPNLMRNIPQETLFRAGFERAFKLLWRVDSATVSREEQK